MVKRLNRFQCCARINLFIQSRVFAGRQINFEAGVGIGKAAANRSGEFFGAHRRLAQSAKAQCVAAEALPRYGDRGRRGSGAAVERAERFKEFDRRSARRGRQIAHRAAAPAEAEDNQNRISNQTDP